MRVDLYIDLTVGGMLIHPHNGCIFSPPDGGALKKTYRIAVGFLCELFGFPLRVFQLQDQYQADDHQTDCQQQSRCERPIR